VRAGVCGERRGEGGDHVLAGRERRLVIYGRLKRETENSQRPKQGFLWFG